MRSSWTSRAGGCRNSFGRLRNSRTMDQMFLDGQKEKWKEKLQEIVEKRHQRMQKRSQEMQGIKDKKRNLLKEACACDAEMREVREEINEREERYLELAGEVEHQLNGSKKIWTCREEKKEEAAVMDAAMTRLWSSSSLWERRMRDGRSKPVHEEFVRRFGRKSGKRSKCKKQPVVKWVHQRQVGAMKVSGWFCF